MAYRYVSHVKEEHGNPIFGVKFNELLDEEGTFATVGSNREFLHYLKSVLGQSLGRFIVFYLSSHATVYRYGEDGNIKPLQAYCDSNMEECFYTCTWSINKDSRNSLLVVAGVMGILRVIDTTSVTCWKSYSGHGNAVNELKTHPLIPQLILSASKDHSLRLWNIQTDVCVAIFGGVDGHRDEVLGADFHILGGSIVSCGMDHSLKLWQLDTSEIKDAIEASERPPIKKNFPTLRCHFPSFSTREVHCNYVDSVCYYGNTILSKSCENLVAWWKPAVYVFTSITDPTAAAASTTSHDGIISLRKLDVPQCEIWFMKMCLNERLGLLALGNQIGKITLWDMTTEDASKSNCQCRRRTPPLSVSPPPLTTLSQSRLVERRHRHFYRDKSNEIQVLGHTKCNSAIRHVAISKNARHIVCVCDNATVWLWDHKTSCDHASTK